MTKNFAPQEDLTIASYFWTRKRNETLKMVKRNVDRLFPKGHAPYRFVDLGTGRGEDLLMLYEGIKAEIRSQTTFVGVDAVAERLERARQAAAEKNISDVHLILHDITTRLPFEDGSVDFVYSSEVVEHLLSPESFFREIRRILKKNGFFLMTTMNQPNFLEAEYWSLKWRLKSEKKRTQPSESEKIMVGGNPVAIFGHISLRTLSVWDSCLKQEGYRLVDAARGALRYGLPQKMNQHFVLRKLLLFFESLLDIFPRAWVRGFSCQTIALYQLQAK